MNAIRQFKDVVNNSFEVTLPADFGAKRVEVIIIPDDSEPPISDSTKKMLAERLKYYEENPEDILDFDEVMRELEQDL